MQGVRLNVSWIFFPCSLFIFAVRANTKKKIKSRGEFKEFAKKSDRHRVLIEKINAGMRMKAEALKKLTHRKIT
jgi:hypothetical protein